MLTILHDVLRKDNICQYHSTLITISEKEVLTIDIQYKIGIITCSCVNAIRTNEIQSKHKPDIYTELLLWK